MPVHNALPHLDEAVESILSQTLSEFEFVILDDASTDGSTARLREWSAKDPRIRLLEVKENLGPALSSQRVAQAALAPIVARMDADDIAYPDRLRQQFEALSENPNAGVVGCLCDIIASGGQRIRGAEPWKLIRRTPLIPFVHGATMYRQSVFSRVGGYRQECIYWEDHDLVTRMAAISDVLVIPKALVQVRQSSGSTRFNAMFDGFEQALDLMYRCLDRVARGQGYEDLLMAGAVGGILSRLQRELQRRDVPSDYGLSWSVLFLSPVSGALSAWAGVLLMQSLQKLNVIDLSTLLPADADLTNPSGAILGIAILFGFSERLLDRIVRQATEEIGTKAQNAKAVEVQPEPPTTAGVTAPIT